MTLPTNALARARSSYLRSAMHQPVQWLEWSPEAFASAQEQDKPILLDIGAVWCHWCHVMDRESYEDPETARILNEHFIAIKVDRDERPDIDTRYQAAVAAISGQGGWPLTAFLTPDGRPFFGGTYFPPVDGHGRPSLRRVLMTMAESFERRRDEVFDTAASVMAAIEHNESFDGSAQDPGPQLLDKLIAATLHQFDKRFGGFGSQPKFPHAGGLDLLLDTAARPGPNAAAARQAAMVTLEKMSQGGIYDHLAGGFHRYSVDERWVVPHFEKMSYDNSELLRTYVHAFQTLAEPECARIARETIAWIDTTLSDRDRGGFYASQDADLSPEDDGDFFTWTRAEAAAVLTAAELAVIEPWFDLGPIGDMHHNPEKNTLHIDRPLAAVAKSLNLPIEEAAARIRDAKPKLLAARNQRPAPYVDQTLYTGWNAMMISAYLDAGRVLPAPDATAFALRSLDRLLAAAWNGQTLHHVIAYAADDALGDPIPGLLDDYVFTAHACLDAWETTGQYRYFERAEALGEILLTRFADTEKGGFFDTEVPAEDEIRLGALSARRKPLQDSPTPAGNPVAASLFLRLAALTTRADLRPIAQATLESFAGVVEHFGLYAASYGLALRRLTTPSIQVVVLGADALADSLERTALAPYAVNKSVIRLRQPGPLPPALAETIPHLPAPGSQAVVCTGSSCQPPTADPEALQRLLRASS